MTEKQFLRWEKQRKNGKWFWIIKVALMWAFVMFSAFYIYFWYFNRPTVAVFSMIPFLIFGGFIVGFVGWNKSEGSYQTHLLDDKIREGFNA
jgi:amino acid transporter